MVIPKKFCYLGHTVQVVWMAESEAEENHGLWVPSHCEIRISPKPCDSFREHAFCHELSHAWLDVVEPKLSKDEAKVDLMGALVHQFLNTAKGEL